MSEVGEMYAAWREERRELRAKHGVECPQCKTARPRACASILLPGQVCRVDGYRDPRPRLPRWQQ